jgi:hypothetical protein
MKTALLLVSASLFAALGASAPASAESCPAQSVDLPDVDADLAPDCSLSVVLFGDMACLWTQGSKTVRTANLVLTYYYCQGPGVGQPADAPLACDVQGIQDALTGSGVFVNGDCTIDVVLFSAIECAGPWVGTVEETVGPVHFIAYYCKGPDDPIG